MSDRPLRILHLFANYKWTGPADPAMRAAARLRARGLDVVFAQASFVAVFVAAWAGPALAAILGFAARRAGACGPTYSSERPR